MPCNDSARVTALERSRPNGSSGYAMTVLVTPVWATNWAMAWLANPSDAVVRTNSSSSGKDASETAVAPGEHTATPVSMRRGNTSKATFDDRGPMRASIPSSLTNASTDSRAVVASAPSSATTNSMGRPSTPPPSLMARTVASAMATSGSPSAAPSPDWGTSKPNRNTPSESGCGIVVENSGVLSGTVVASFEEHATTEKATTSKAGRRIMRGARNRGAPFRPRVRLRNDRGCPTPWPMPARGGIALPWRVPLRNRVRWVCRCSWRRW